MKVNEARGTQARAFVRFSYQLTDVSGFQFVILINFKKKHAIVEVTNIKKHN